VAIVAPATPIATKCIKSSRSTTTDSAAIAMTNPNTKHLRPSAVRWRSGLAKFSANRLAVQAIISPTMGMPATIHGRENAVSPTVTAPPQARSEQIQTRRAARSSATVTPRFISSIDARMLPPHSGHKPVLLNPRRL
jgi:hypothetical protein